MVFKTRFSAAKTHQTQSSFALLERPQMVSQLPENSPYAQASAIVSASAYTWEKQKYLERTKNSC